MNKVVSILFGEDIFKNKSILKVMSVVILLTYSLLIYNNFR